MKLKTMLDEKEWEKSMGVGDAEKTEESSSQTAVAEAPTSSPVQVPQP